MTKENSDESRKLIQVEESKKIDNGFVKTEVNSKNKAAEMAKKAYDNNKIFKTIFKITFPVFILMLVNSSYQMIDTIIAANLVDYGSLAAETITFNINEIFHFEDLSDKLSVNEVSEAIDGVYNGAIVMQYMMPMVMFCFAMTVLINVGYGTMFSQKMGAGDIEGAKSATSTALWGAALLGGISFFVAIILGPFIIRWNIPATLYELGVGEVIENDAKWTCAIYSLTIYLSGFQGVVSRQLRAEGHIKSMSYLPLISIPINILLDWVLMGPVGMNAVGAGVATFLSMLLSSFIIYTYAIWARTKNKTLFTFKAFKGKLDFKILVPIIMIGMVPFFMQILRIYDIELGSQIIKRFVQEIPDVTIMNNEINNYISTIGGIENIAPNDVRYMWSEIVFAGYSQIGQWSTFFTASTRPMMLIIMPGLSVLQAGSAYLGYHFGAKNYHKVNKGILVMIVVMLIYALPSWIFLLSLSKYVLVWFGAASSYSQVSSDMITIHRIIIGLAILNCFVMAPNAYVISTKRFKTGISMQVINLIIVYTIVLLLCYFIFSGKDYYYYFYTYNAFFTGCSAIVGIIILGTTIFLDHKKLIKEGHVDAS